MFKLLGYCICLVSVVLSVSRSDFEVWGPGLNPQNVVMPARYFLISFSNHSCDEKLPLSIEVKGLSSGLRSCRIQTNLLQTYHCLNIVRYKLYETCTELQITVKYNNEHIGKSPYIIKDVVYSDDCDCKIMKLPTWLNKWECGDVPKKITKDLANYDSIDFNSLRSKIISTYNNPGAVSLCHYAIKNNQIYRQCYGKYVGFKMFMDNILLSLIRKVELPDVEFFLNLGDWPLAKTREFPIFSWSGSDDSYDIVLPTYDITESTLENMGRVMLDMLSVQGNVNSPWKHRLSKLFWRGRDSNQERLLLIDIARQSPHLFNASLTNFFFFRDKESQYGPKSEHVSFFKFFDYKYQLNIDGTVAAYRFPYLLAGGSLVLKQDSKYYEHFYKDLRASYHYIPVNHDLSNLVEKINWVQENDEKASSIAHNGWKFAVDNLLPKNIFCYHVHLFYQFSKKISNSINRLEGMEEVTNESKCNCDKTKDEL